MTDRGRFVERVRDSHCRQARKILCGVRFSHRPAFWRQIGHASSRPEALIGRARSASRASGQRPRRRSPFTGRSMGSIKPTVCPKISGSLDQMTTGVADFPRIALVYKPGEGQTRRRQAQLSVSRTGFTTHTSISLLNSDIPTLGSSLG